MLVDKVRVLTVPGIEFGMEGHLRLSTCGAIKDITEGIERMKWALDPNAPNPSSTVVGQLNPRGCSETRIFGQNQPRRLKT